MVTFGPFTLDLMASSLWIADDERVAKKIDAEIHIFNFGLKNSAMLVRHLLGHTDPLSAVP